MLIHGINIRLGQLFFYLMIALMYYSCMQSISAPENENVEILQTSLELNRFENELFFQVITNQNESQELINTVSVELTYIGDNIHEYSGTFHLYDNATNGDLISSNGIYTLLTHADTVSVPGLEPGIKDIEIAQNFMLHKTDSDSLDVSVTIVGKSFRFTVSVLDANNNTTLLSKNVNLDNSYIELKINTDYMYMDNTQTPICDRSQTETPDPNAFESYFEWANGVLSNSYSNEFVFTTKIPFRSLSDCGGTGNAIFRFILHDLNRTDGLEVIADDIELNIYGCGDGYCTLELENSNICPEDCQ